MRAKDIIYFIKIKSLLMFLHFAKKHEDYLTIFLNQALTLICLLYFSQKNIIRTFCERGSDLPSTNQH